MEHNWLLYIIIFAAAFAVSLVFTPVAKRISIKLGGIDYPKDRGMHKDLLPRMGGIAIILGFAVAMVISLPFVPELRTTQFLGFTAGALIIAILGGVDDIKHLRARTRFPIQIIAALIVVFTGTRINIEAMHIIPNAVMPFPKSFDAPITVIWIVGLVNALNFIDGADGLAAGVTGIASFCLMILCALTGAPAAVVFAAALAGSCLGFLPRNFNPAEIIMGDTGATFLGFTLAVTSIIGVYKSYALLSVVVAVLALALPIFNIVFVTFMRIIRHKPIMAADRGHLHDRLKDAGFSHKQVVVILYLVSAACAVCAVLIAIQNVIAAVITAIAFLVILLMIFVYRKRIKRNG